MYLYKIHHLVLAKSSGYTKHSEVAPAAPPDARFPAKYRQNCVFLLTPSKKTDLYTSLKAKLRACVGKYRITFARFPRQKELIPCSLEMRMNASTMPEFDKLAVIKLYRYSVR